MDLDHGPEHASVQPGVTSNASPAVLDGEGEAPLSLHNAFDLLTVTKSEGLVPLGRGANWVAANCSTVESLEFRSGNKASPG